MVTAGLKRGIYPIITYPLETAMSWRLLLPIELCIAAVLGFLAEGVANFIEKKDTLHTHGVPWGPFDRRAPVEYSFQQALLYGLGFCSLWLLADFILMVFPYIHNAYSWLLRLLGLQLTEVFVSALIVGLGFLAFWFKARYQFAYGLVEVIFAAVAAIVTTRQIIPNMSWGTTIASYVGAIYIVSRGLNNIRDAKVAREAK
jgi:hypothetical protein